MSEFLTCKEIAKKMGVSEQTARSRIKKMGLKKEVRKIRNICFGSEITQSVCFYDVSGLELV